jgi:hypothetical protein
MTANTITLGRIQALAEQLEADAAAVRRILAMAQDGDLSPAQAAQQLHNLGIAILP